MQEKSWTNSITGTWELKSFIVQFDDGSQYLPYGSAPQGRISYAEDGFMTAHLWNPDLHVDGAAPADDPTYFSYCGDWSVDGDIVRHRVHAATHPSWTARDKLRSIAMRGTQMELTAENVDFAGKRGRGILIWQRRHS